MELRSAAHNLFFAPFIVEPDESKVEAALIRFISARQVGTMAVFAIVCGIAGIMLGWRFAVIALVPCILAIVAIIVAFEVVHHQSVKTAVVTLVLSVGLLQLGYLAGRVFKTALRAYSVPEARVRYRPPDCEPPVSAAGGGQS